MSAENENLDFENWIRIENIILETKQDLAG